MFLYKQVNLPLNVELRNSLQKIYGIGQHKSFVAASKIGLSYPFFINNLNFYNFYLLSSVLNGLTWLEIRIKQLIKLRLFSLIDMECYKGIRHVDALPCRGQRTRTNARTRKRLKRIL